MAARQFASVSIKYNTKQTYADNHTHTYTMCTLISGSRALSGLKRNVYSNILSPSAKAV